MKIKVIVPNTRARNFKHLSSALAFYNTSVYSKMIFKNSGAVFQRSAVKALPLH